jgi:hypothetical protein
MHITVITFFVTLTPCTPTRLFKLDWSCCAVEVIGTDTVIALATLEEILKVPIYKHKYI